MLRACILLSGFSLLCLPAAARAEDEARAFIRALTREYMERPANNFGVEAWVRNIRNGNSATDVHIAFLAGDEFYQLHGRDPRAVIAAMYRHLLERRPTAEETAAWLSRWRDLRADRANGRVDFVKDFFATVRPRLRLNPPLPEHLPALLVRTADLLQKALDNEVGRDEGRRLHALADMLATACERYKGVFFAPDATPRDVREAYRAAARAFADLQAEMGPVVDPTYPSAGYARQVGDYLKALKGQLPPEMAAPPPPPLPGRWRDRP